eukprot:1152200-Pelagomonas_calceolata.AAC.3
MPVTFEYISLVAALKGGWGNGWEPTGGDSNPLLNARSLTATFANMLRNLCACRIFLGMLMHQEGPSGQGQLQGHGRAPKQYQQQQQQQQQQQGPVQLGSRVDASGEGGTLQGGAGQGSNRASDSSSMRGSRMLESQGKDGKSRKRRLTAAEASSPHALALFQAWRRPHTLQDMLRARQQALRR